MRTIATILFFAALIGISIPASAMGPEGLWSVRNGRAKVKVETCDGETLCANIVWLRHDERMDSQGRPRSDANNKNPKMRRRPIIGLPVAYNMVQTKSNKWSGVVYDPEKGGTYKGWMTLLPDGRMKVTGCIASFLCQTKFWKPLSR